MPHQVTDPFYLTPLWRALRRACLERDGNKCTVAGCNGTERLTADHIIPRRKGGADALSNLRTLCQPCHSRITRKGNIGDVSAKGCDAQGRPLDPDHPWHKSA